MTGSAIKVLVVDENWLVRLGLSSLLSEDGQFGQILESDSVAGALAVVQQYAPDVVICDVHLPDGSGIDMCSQIRRANPLTHVMFLTTCCHEDLVISAMLAGASGYILKNNDPERLRADVLTVAAGGSVLDGLVSDIVLQWMRRAAESGRGADRITEHERKILPLIAQGKTNRQIAAELYLSEHTIKTYVSALLKKLQLARRSEAAAYIARQEQLRAS
jgi:DNA-binding NarL/FixJ family response regulator